MNLPLVTEAPPLSVDSSGSLRIGNTRVLLELVIRAFQDGVTAEAIVQRYPSLSLSDTYSTIGYYLRHTAEIDTYLAGQEEKAETVKAKIIAAQPQLQQIRDRCNLNNAEDISPSQRLLNQMAATGGVLWSSQTDSGSVQALFELIETAKANTHT
jgi:uncharacterized protein (DUF433 family)